MLTGYDLIKDGYIKKTDDQKAPIEQSLNDQKVQKKINLLRKTWPKDKDNEPARIIAPILYLRVKPIYYFIIIDDYKKFIKIYNENKDFKRNKDYTNACGEGVENNNYLEVACLSGSKEIATFLLCELNKNYMDYNYLLSYVATSPNFVWAIEIASILKKNNRPMPPEFYCYVEDLDRIDSIKEVFSPNNIEGFCRKMNNYDRIFFSF